MKKGDRVNITVEYIAPYSAACTGLHVVKARITDNNVTPGIELIVHESVLIPVEFDNEGT